MIRLPAFRHGVRCISKSIDRAPRTRIALSADNVTVNVWQNPSGALIKLNQSLPFYAEVGIYYELVTDAQQESIKKAMPDWFDGKGNFRRSEAETLLFELAREACMRATPLRSACDGAEPQCIRCRAVDYFKTK